MLGVVRPHDSVCCIGVASSLGTSEVGSAAAPEALITHSLADKLRHTGLACHLDPLLYPRLCCAFPLKELLRRLSERTEAVVSRGERVIVVGGDHSMAAGTWKGVARALGRMPGLIWIDAHLDAHVPATSPSGNLHGMPVAALLGESVPEMSDIEGPALSPSRLVIVGARSFETAEKQFLDRLGVHIIDAQQIAALGLRVLLEQARKWLGDGPWGISLDIDALDPTLAPGVNTPVAEGLNADELCQALRGVFHERDFVGLEIAEYNPKRDPDGRTARLIQQLMCGSADLI